MKKIGFLCIFILYIFMLSGCSTKKDAVSKESYSALKASMESTAIIDYVVPVYTPNVLVDTLGYQSDMLKKAAIKGEVLPKEFRIIDVGTGECVYSGEVSFSDEDKEDNICLGYAHFSDFSKEGTYYIECDILGRSNTFKISDSLYMDMFRDSCDKLIEKCEDNTVTNGEIITLLTAYEWYPELFEDEDGDLIPDMLKTVADRMSTLQENTAWEPGIEESAILAKLSYLYQSFNRQYALSCLQKATLIYNQNKSTTNTDSTDFYALVELYRASGSYTHRTQISNLRTYFESNSSYLEDLKYRCAAMTYLFTRQRVDVELCNIFMSGINDKAEEISGRYEDMIAPLKAKNNGVEDILKRALDILFSDYVLPSYQYDNILADFLHYLGGINNDSIDFYSSENSVDFMLILAQLASVEE